MEKDAPGEQFEILLDLDNFYPYFT